MRPDAVLGRHRRDFHVEQPCGQARPKKQREEALILRGVVAGGAVLLGVSAVVAQQDVAKQQDDLMRTTFGRPFYGVLLKMSRGQAPYDQAAVEGALSDLEKAVPTIPATFQTNPKM